MQLRPRIRTWKHVNLSVPNDQCVMEHIEHIQALLSGPSDWTLITTHLPEMLRVAISISQGKMRASTLLRKLGTSRRTNKLYGAFCALGRVVRTVFLLHFISDPELRRTINATTHSAENGNELVPGAAFGGEGVIRHHNRAEQRKVIRYKHRVAHVVVFHNVVSMTRMFQELVNEGYPITPEILANFSPYRTEHLNRFGNDDVRFDQKPPPLIEGLRLSPDLAVRVN